MLPEELRYRVPSRPEYTELEARYARIVHKRTFQPLVWRLKRRATEFCRAFGQHREFIVLAVGSPLAVGVLLFVAYMLFLPQSIHYAFADQKSCVGSPTIFPSLLKTNSQTTFRLSHEPTISIGHTPIFSYRLCATPIHDPSASVSYINHQWIPIGGLRVGKAIKVVTADYPVAFDGSLGTKAIPLEKPLVFTLNRPDATFNYALVANGQTAPCSKQKSVLSCSLTPLQLAYAANYHVALVRLFHSQAGGRVLSKNLQTITATAITQTSISQGATVYNQPQQITINTDKTITNLQTISLSLKNTNGTTTAIPITSSFKGDTITVNFANALPRKASLDLHIDNLTASDDSRLEQPYDLTFITSGGPKVTNANIPSYGLASGQTMIVAFDQALGSAQDPNQFASLLVNGVKQPASISLSGQQLIIKPTNTYPVCANVTVQLSAVAQNAYGVAGDSAWSYTSRSHCYTTYSIGTSVDGRPITAYQFGSGPSMVLYIAAMEGNEQNSAELLQQWVPDIDANPGKIPSDRTIVVIPQINPDGFAADTRVNAAGIDLNRNFPANNWQTQVTEPLANTVWTNDGGPYPLSAPESQALANFYEAHHPRLTLTMHSHGGIVEANDAGDSIALGAKYAALADYRAIPTSAIGNFFDYTTTGAFEDWANDKLGLPVLEVELESPTADEYARNLPALWAMAQVSP
jgi:protein MpaA